MNEGWKTTGKKWIEQSLDNGLTYKELLVMYEKECKRKGVSEITFKGYDCAGKYYMDFAGENITLGKLTNIAF